MSDDRFKQARRSLIDRNKQRQQEQSANGPGEIADDDFHEDEKTLMVNVDELQGSPGGQPGGQQRSNPPQRSRPQQRRPQDGQQGGQAHRGQMHSGPASDDFGDDDFADAATQMVDIHSFESGPSGGNNHVEESTQPSREALSVGPGPSGAPPSGPSGGGNQQVFSPGGGGGHEGKTDFINIADFAQDNAAFAPDTNSAGYEGKTAFVQIDELQGAQQQQSAPSGPGNIANDQMLRQSYQFGPESIQQGEVTLIFAQNPLGRQVVLRQVWAGDPRQAPADIRQRIAQLDSLDHPRLVELNGVVATQSGLWADLQKPEGYRLSAVLQQHGPQDKENVITWVKQAAEVLDQIHGAELLYGNLTPDAIWIQEDNSIVLEPFDLLSFEKRGDLGPYGAQELKRPEQDRQLSPATDVFSLAALAAAALTGLPFHAEKLSNYEDEKLAKKLMAALSANPGERPQSAGELADQFKSGGFSLDGLSLDPSELDIKVVAVIAFLLLGGFAGYMYWNKQQKAQARQQQARQQAVAPQQQPQAAEAGANAQAGAGGGAAQGAEGGSDDPNQPAAAPPGTVEQDSRLQIVSSYKTNPPAQDSETELSDDEAKAKAKTLREEARKHLEEAKDLASDSEKRNEYRSGLEALTSAIRLSGGEPSDEDKELLDKFHSQKLMRTYKNDLREQLSEAMAEGSVSEAARHYKSLYAIDYRANAADFFNRNATSSVRTVHEPKKDDEKDD